MTERIASRPPELVSTLDAASIKALIETDEAFIFTFEPDSLRTVCEDYPAAFHILADKLRGLVQQCPDDIHRYERPGFRHPLTDAEWLKKMAKIAADSIACAPFPYDEDESTYDRHLAKKQAKDERRKAKEIAAKQSLAERENLKNSCARDNIMEVPPTAPQLRPSPAKSYSHVDAGPINRQHKESAQQSICPTSPPHEIDRSLPTLRPAQFHLPRFIAGSCAISLGPSNGVRRRWTDTDMRVIDIVSGFAKGEVVIKYYGDELRVEEFEVWMKLLVLASGQSTSKAISFSKRKFLQWIGRGVGSNSYAALATELNRLKAATFKIRTKTPAAIEAMKLYFPDDETVQKVGTNGWVEISFSMISELIESDSGYSIKLPDTVRALIGKGLSTWLDECMYFSLKRGYARRLYLLYSTHTQCWPLTVTELQEYMGSTMGTAHDFKVAMDAAHNELKAKGAITAWAYKEVPRRGRALAYVVRGRKNKA